MGATPNFGRFGRYELLFPIARGGMGEVYAARAHGAADFSKLVALKTIRPEFAKDRKLVERFENEGKLAANISSPHVASTLDFGVAKDGTLYLVMEFVMGVSLRELIRDTEKLHKNTPLPILIEVLVQTAQGLSDAHHATDDAGKPLGLIHRDLSPHNVMVGTDGRCRIVDFGVARALFGDSMTQTGEVVGKMGYFSPEQLSGMPLDQRSDLFALGIISWELLAGRRLFQSDFAWQTVRMIMEDPVPNLHGVRPDIPEDICEAIHRCLERDPIDRYQSAADFASTLRKAAAVGPGLSEPRELARWVKKKGGERVRELQRALRSGSSAEHAVPVSASQTGEQFGGEAGAKAEAEADLTVSSGSREKASASKSHVKTDLMHGVPLDEEGSVFAVELDDVVGEQTEQQASSEHTEDNRGRFTFAMTLRTNLLKGYARSKPRKLQLAAIAAATIFGVWFLLRPSPEAPPTAATSKTTAPALPKDTAVDRPQLLTAPKAKSASVKEESPTETEAPNANKTEEKTATASKKTRTHTRRRRVARSKPQEPVEPSPSKPVVPINPAPAATPPPKVQLSHRWLRGVDEFDQETTK